MATRKIDYSPWEMQGDDTLTSYYQRLAAQRQGGILGTQGLMDVPEVAKPLAEVTKNTPTCPVGTVWNGTACVPVQQEETGLTPEELAKMKMTPEEMAEDALRRQLQIDGPRAVEAAGLFIPGGFALKNFEDWSDQQKLMNYNLAQGFDERYGEGTSEALSKNPLAMAHLMSTGDMNALGDFGNFDTASYKPKGWTDLGKSMFDDAKSMGGSVVADIMGIGNQISDGLFGTNRVWEAQEDQRLANMRAQQDKWAAISAGQVADAEARAAQYGIDPTGMMSGDIDAAIAQEIAQRAAAARMIADQQAMASGSSGTGYTYRPASAASRKSSALGSGSNVGSRGGNASRGFSSGGW